MQKKCKDSKYNTHLYIVITFVLMTISVFIIGKSFYHLYEISKQSIIQKWQNIAEQTANRINYHLQMPIDAIEFSSVSMNAMSRSGASFEEVIEYLRNETKVYSSTINDNTTGIYGYYNGVYLDGSGWIPPDDYKPTERPWYKEAVKAQGEVCLVQPFFNLQTQTMMMSVCKLLEDGRTVISMDIFLDSIHGEIAKVAETGYVRQAYVIDNNGYVVASSNPEEIGSFIQVSSIILANNIKTSFSVPINSEWQCLLLMNDKTLFRSLGGIYLMSGIVLLIVILIIFGTFIFINRKYKRTACRNDEVGAITDIYQAVMRFDIAEDSLTTIKGFEEYDSIISECSKDWSRQYKKFSEKLASRGAALILRDFLNPLTLSNRLEGTKSISVEFLNNKEHWLRARYIAENLNDDSGLERALLAIESIDEDKKRQEVLKRFSETDLMTGIRNRGSGEQQVRRVISEGSQGMFCLLDVDNLKSINDNFGHQIGDEVIKAIADCLKKTFRDSDVVFRLDGDEFAVFCGGVNDQEIGDRLLQRLFFHVKKIGVPKLGDKAINISVGATFYPEFPKDTFEEMYSRADEGADKSKNERGNQVTFNSIKNIVL